MYRHRIPKATVNKLRRLFIASPFNKKAAAARLKIAYSTVCNYAAEFRRIRSRKNGTGKPGCISSLPVRSRV
jgi:transposase